MPIDPTAVGATSGPFEWGWDATDCMLYALAVGAGTDDLAFSTEHGDGAGQKVLPTFATLGGPRRPPPEVVGSYDPAMLVHGEHAVELAGPLPLRVTVSTTATIVGIWDKGSGALVVTESRSVDAETGEWRFTNRAGAFIRGEGGWGGPRGPAPAVQASRVRAPPGGIPDGGHGRAADFVVSYQTAPGQALLYRLCGDRNPIHSDPAYARKAGFERPILHGLCTWGFTGRALLHILCDSDPSRLASMEGRFAAPVHPGDLLIVSIWADGDSASFDTRTQRGDVVLDRGHCRLA